MIVRQGSSSLRHVLLQRAVETVKQLVIVFSLLNFDRRSCCFRFSLLLFLIRRSFLWFKNRWCQRTVNSRFRAADGLILAGSIRLAA